ncbi:hypothetical protein AAY473_029317 [Plecturocebus cupreus]
MRSHYIAYAGLELLGSGDPPASASQSAGIIAASPTWEVAAASGRAAPYPAALIHRHCPGLKLIRLQSIGREVADLQLCEMVDEILIGHPERLEEEREPYGSGMDCSGAIIVHCSLNLGSSDPLLQPPKTSSLLGLGLGEENRAQISQGLESDNLIRGLRSEISPLFPIPYPSGSSWVPDSPELSILSDLVLQMGLLIFVHKAPVLPAGGGNGGNKEGGRREGLMLTENATKLDGPWKGKGLRKCLESESTTGNMDIPETRRRDTSEGISLSEQGWVHLSAAPVREASCDKQ